MTLSTICKLLDDFFPNPQIPLDHDSPFTLLVAVLLSAQCTDTKVNTVTPLLFSLAKTPQEMLQIPSTELEEILRPCGLQHKKSAQLLALSHILVSRFAGKVPSCLPDLLTLPGVGHKTASVVLLQAFGIPAFPVDTHIHRSATRWHLSSGKSVHHTESDLKRLFPPQDWGKRHLQILLFARKFCVAKRHNPKACPICATLL